MRLLLGLLGMVAIAAAAAAWVLARMLETEVFRVRPRNDPLNLRVVEVTERTIRLKPLSADGAKEVRRTGRYGFEFEGGYAEAGAIIKAPADPWAPVTRAFAGRRGEVQAGTLGRMDSFAFEPDPSAVGLAWEPATVGAGDVTFPAWLLAADPGRWVIFVHGKGARREEALRVLPLVHGEGWTCMVTTYRNDVGCGGEGYYRYGVDEWEDLEAAVQFAAAGGAEKIVIAAYSMGGAIALSFMGRSSLAGLVRGLILDSPMSDLGALLAMRLRQRRVPPPLPRMATAIAARRAGIRARAAAYHQRAVTVPVLLLHGDLDDIIPIRLSERFATNRENVTFVRIAGAGHVRGWNVDRERYERAIREFLRAARAGAAVQTPPEADGS